MSNEQTTTQAAPEAASPSTSTEAPSFTQETPSSTVDNLPQSEGDFATWLSDRLEKFEKGEEVAPWEQKEEEADTQEEPESKEEEVSESDEQGEKEAEGDEEETKNMSAAAGAKFKELKSELKEYKARAAEALKVLEESKNSSAATEELESLRSRLAEYEKEISVTRIEATPEYKKAVLEPTQAILDAASTMAERYKLDARKLVGALREESVSEGSDALTELAADFSERDRVRLYRMADDLSDVSRRRDHLRENASQAYAEHQESLKAEEAKMERAYREETAHAASKVWQDTFSDNPAFEGLGNDALQNIQTSGSESDLLEASPDVRAYAVYAGVALPHLIKQVSEYREKTASLEKALSKYKKASPKVSGNTDTSPAIVDDGGFLDAIEKRFSLG